MKQLYPIYPLFGLYRLKYIRREGHYFDSNKIMIFKVNTESEYTESSKYLEPTVAEIILQESLLIDEVVQFEKKKRKVQEILKKLQQLADNIELTIEKVEGDQLTINIEGSEISLKNLQQFPHMRNQKN